MDTRFLFDSEGSWVAFVDGRFVFARDGSLLGWTPWDDHPDEVVNPSGDYVATIVGENGHERLFRFRDQPYRGYAGRPDDPGYRYPGHPGWIEATVLPIGAEDVNPRELSTAL